MEITKLKNLLNNFFFKFKRKILSKTIYRNNFKTPEFFQYFFSQQREKFIVQVGGNDGIQNDPLRQYFKYKGNYRALIFEPIKFYYEQIKNLYEKREDIQLKNAFISNVSSNKKIFYINPKICQELNGEKYSDNWANGLGSFDRNSIIKAIDANSFRGVQYINNIEKFKNSIISEEVVPFELKNLNFPVQTINLLVIDVQGSELEVLNSLTFNEKIDYIVYEDEEPNSINSNKIRRLLKSSGYKLIGRINWLDQIYFKKY